MHIQTLPEISIRQKEIVKDYLVLLDKHIKDLKCGEATDSLEIKEFADRLHIHPTHLSNTINQVLGTSPCDLFEQKLVIVAKELLQETTLPIGEIAHQLFYDPSNFTKFFKHFEGITPKQFRQQNSKI